eukprot:4005629-Karenia_brevis.AAC.1
MSVQGLDTNGCLEAYNAEVRRAIDAAAAVLDPSRAAALRDWCRDAAADAGLRYDDVRAGTRRDAAGPPVGAGHAGSLLVSPPGSEDAEHRDGAGRV